MEIEKDEDKLLNFFLKYKRCPDCGSKEFYEGPSGGMSTNIRCGGCKHRFNMALPICVERI
jgi:DNA-directed RNA polymerase subunit RPC12/RpoP